MGDDRGIVDSAHVQYALIEHQESDIMEIDIAGLHSLTMLDFLVGWVELAESGLLSKKSG